MVDTINPNTNEPDRFYSGFDKPENVKINLAGNEPQPGQAPAQPQPEMTPPQPELPQQPTAQTTPAPGGPVSDVAPVAPTEVQHTTYTTAREQINWRGILVIVAIGVVSSLVFGAALYFILSGMNNSKIANLQTELETVDKDLTAAKETPVALELPTTEENTETNTETTTQPSTPVVKPTETPTIETPATTPATNTDESKTAAG